MFKKQNNLSTDNAQPASHGHNGSAGQNPYLNAREEWLERYGSYISRAAQWRFFALFCLLITGISITGNVWQAQQSKVVPYLVEVDKLGKVAAVSRADAAMATPRKVIQAEIAAFISDWRTVTVDVDLQRKMIDRVSFFVAGAGKGQVREFYEQNNPYAIAKAGKLVQVEVKGVPLPVSADSYRVEWSETVRNHAGVVLDIYNYEATVSIQLNPPTTDAVLIKNPGGVYITSLHMAKVLPVGGNPAVQTGQPAFENSTPEKR